MQAFFRYVANLFPSSWLGFFAYPFFTLLISWVHYFTTQSLKVDDNPIIPFSLRLLCFAVLVWTYIGYYGLLVKKQNSITLPNILFKQGLVFIALSFFTLPLFSNDFFSLVGYSEAVVKGHNVYKGFDAAVQTSLSHYMNPLYAKLDCKYGPLTVWSLSLPFLFKMPSIWGVLWMSKIIFLFYTFVYLFYSYQIAKLKPALGYFLLLSPIWFVQGLGQFHNDIFGVSILVAGYYFLLKEKSFYAAILFALAVLFKFTFILFLIVPFAYYLEEDQRINLKKWTITLLVMIATIAVVGYGVYSPLIDDVSQLLSPIQAMDGERPSSSFADITAYAMLLISPDFSANYGLTIPFFKKIGLGIMLFIGFLYIKNYKVKDIHKYLVLFLFTTLILVYSHRFLPWYLVTIPIFLSTAMKDHWAKWFIVISFVSMFQDFAILLNTDNLLGQITMVLSTILTVLSYFFLIRKRLKPFKGIAPASNI